MSTDPQQIRAAVHGVLADLPTLDSGTDTHGAAPADIDTIDAIGRRLEHAHQILVDALESVEKG